MDIKEIQNSKINSKIQEIKALFEKGIQSRNKNTNEIILPQTGKVKSRISLFSQLREGKRINHL